MKKQFLSRRLSVYCVILVLSMLWVIPATAQSSSSTPATAAANSDSKEIAKASEPKDSSPPPQVEKGVFSRQFKTSFEIGGQIVDVSGERPSKFEETKRVREGFILRKFRIASNPELNPAFFNLVGRGAGERDERYLLDMGRFGKFRTTAEYTRFPHLYARGARSLLSYSGNGLLTVPDNIQQTLQNAASADLPALVSGFVAQSRALDLRTQRAMLKIKQTINLTSHWSARARFVDIKKYGSRPMGIGSYERIGTGAGDTFRVLSIELPEPIDHRTSDLTVGTSYVRSNWGVNFDYTYSKFNNRISTLTFDNPFRITDLQATGSGGVFDRMSFARGIFSLPPSNKAHSFLVSAFVDLPRHSRLATALGWSFWRQDEEFAPYTLNSAIVASNIPAGTKITDSSALPRKSLEGQVDTFTQDHLFATQLFKNISLNIHYRDYDYQNNTEQIRFPGYAAFGESYWRTDINTKPIANEPVSFRKKTASADVTWAVTKPLDWKFEYKWEGWDRTNRQVKESNEHTVGTQISFSPKPQFSSKLRYHYSDRTPREYDPGILEYVNLRLFDQSKRLRHNADFQVA